MNNKKTIPILQMCPRLDSGGIERGTVDIAIAVRQAGFQSIVASGGGRLVSELTAAGVEHITLPLYLKSPYAIMQNSKKIRNLIDEQHIQLIHASSRAPIWVADRALKPCRIPLVTSCHSPHSLGVLNLKKLYNRVIVSGDRIIAISDFIRQYLIKNYHPANDTLRTIYRGIDMSIFDPEKIDDAELTSLKQQYKIPLHKKIILLPGRITRWKGHDTFIQALAQVISTDAVHGVIVGRVDSVPFLKTLYSLITDLHLTDHITFIEECFNMPPLYAMADITVSASCKPEAFGRVAVEGQAMHSLVIATQLGAATETVLPHHTGFLVAPHNATQLAETIKQVLILSTDEKNKIRRQARQHVVTHFNKKKMLEHTLAVYQECLETFHDTRRRQML